MKKEKSLLTEEFVFEDDPKPKSTPTPADWEPEEWGDMSNFDNFFIRKHDPINVIIQVINEYIESLCDDNILTPLTPINKGPAPMLKGKHPKKTKQSTTTTPSRKKA